LIERAVVVFDRDKFVWRATNWLFNHLATKQYRRGFERVIIAGIAVLEKAKQEQERRDNNGQN
jgi:hypothetical protein